MSKITQVVNNDKMTILKTGVIASRLDKILSGTPFTVFASSNLAFGKMAKEVLDNNFLKPENKIKLTDVLNYHIVS